MLSIGPGTIATATNIAVAVAVLSLEIDEKGGRHLDWSLE